MKKLENTKSNWKTLKKKRTNSTKELTNKLKDLQINLEFRFYQLKLESIVYIPSIIFAILLGRLVSAIILIIAFLFIRPATPTTFHFDNVKTCVKTSLKMFLVAISLLFLIPYNISLCFGVIISLWICMDLYKIQYALTDDFDLDTCTKEQLVERCRVRFKRDVEYKTERAVKHFIEKLPHNEIDINPRASEKERERMRKILK